MERTTGALPVITKTKTYAIYANQRTSFVPRNDEKNIKNNTENNSIDNKIHEILSEICFVYTVTFLWNGVLSSEVTEITDNLMN